MESKQRFATSPPYPDSVFDSVAHKLPYQMPVRFLGKVVADSQEFPFKKRARTTNPADDHDVPKGERARYTHGYFQLVDSQALLELVLEEHNTAVRSDGSLTWWHFWNLHPQVVVPWETAGVSYRLEFERYYEELHFNFIVRDWQLEGCAGTPVGNRHPHRANGEFQVALGNIYLGSSWEENETHEIPDRVVNLVGQVVLASRMLVYGCRGKYHSLQGLFEVPTAQVYLDCAESFWRRFPSSELLKYCLDPAQCEQEYHNRVKICLGYQVGE